jgi:hypothetical protein
MADSDRYGSHARDADALVWTSDLEDPEEAVSDVMRASARELEAGPDAPDAEDDWEIPEYALDVGFDFEEDEETEMMAARRRRPRRTPREEPAEAPPPADEPAEALPEAEAEAAGDEPPAPDPRETTAETMILPQQSLLEPKPAEAADGSDENAPPADAAGPSADPATSATLLTGLEEDSWDTLSAGAGAADDPTRKLRQPGRSGEDAPSHGLPDMGESAQWLPGGSMEAQSGEEAPHSESQQAAADPAQPDGTDDWADSALLDDDGTFGVEGVLPGDATSPQDIASTERLADEDYEDVMSVTRPETAPASEQPTKREEALDFDSFVQRSAEFHDEGRDDLAGNAPQAGSAPPGDEELDFADFGLADGGEGFGRDADLPGLPSQSGEGDRLLGDDEAEDLLEAPPAADLRTAAQPQPQTRTDRGEEADQTPPDRDGSAADRAEQEIPAGDRSDAPAQTPEATSAEQADQPGERWDGSSADALLSGGLDVGDLPGAPDGTGEDESGFLQMDGELADLLGRDGDELSEADPDAPAGAQAGGGPDDDFDEEAFLSTLTSANELNEGETGSSPAPEAATDAGRGPGPQDDPLPEGEAPQGPDSEVLTRPDELLPRDTMDVDLESLGLGDVLAEDELADAGEEGASESSERAAALAAALGEEGFDSDEMDASDLLDEAELDLPDAPPEEDGHTGETGEAERIADEIAGASSGTQDAGGDAGSGAPVQALSIDAFDDDVALSGEEDGDGEDGGAGPGESPVRRILEKIPSLTSARELPGAVYRRLKPVGRILDLLTGWSKNWRLYLTVVSVFIIVMCLAVWIGAGLDAPMG